MHFISLYVQIFCLRPISDQLWVFSYLIYNNGLKLPFDENCHRKKSLKHHLSLQNPYVCMPSALPGNKDLLQTIQLEWVLSSQLSSLMQRLFSFTLSSHMYRHINTSSKSSLQNTMLLTPTSFFTLCLTGKIQAVLETMLRCLILCSIT